MAERIGAERIGGAERIAAVNKPAARILHRRAVENFQICLQMCEQKVGDALKNDYPVQIEVFRMHYTY